MTLDGMAEVHVSVIDKSPCSAARSALPSGNLNHWVKKIKCSLLHAKRIFLSYADRLLKS